jgi:hypothetical protein
MIKKILRGLAEKVEMDRAVLFGLLSKVWSVLSGPVSALLITSFFSPALQGYYYTFATVLALQVFVELGLGTVTQQFASHEWAHLKLEKNGEITGDASALSRLISLTQISMKWFLIGSLITAVGLSIGGYIFFSNTNNYNISWRIPWISLSVLTAMNMLFTPIWSILEGCNQVVKLYIFRLIQTVLINISIWTSVVGGLGLWAASVSTIVSIFAAVLFIFLRYKIFFKTLLFNKSVGPSIGWKKDMLPMQWRIAVSWISGYFAFSFFTPILFKYQGPVIAGQFGMSWNIINALGGMAGAWLSPKIPTFAILAGKKNYMELDILFWKIVKIVSLIIFSLSVATLLLILMLPLIHNSLFIKLSSRLLSPLPFGILLMAQSLSVFSTPFPAYLRAHKKEPLMLLSVISGLLIGILTYFLGKKYSATGIALGYLSVLLLNVPTVILIWYRFRKKQILNLEKDL